jgi:predicted protein tyrosine phosphatase
MKISCHSRSEIDAAIRLADNPVCVVSITTPGDEPRFGADYHNILGISFDDADRYPREDETWVISDPVLFTTELAAGVKEFIAAEIADGCESILIHCDAGVSRSAGMAAALAKAYTGDDMWFFRHKRPNMLVYRLMMDTLVGQSPVLTGPDS